MHHLTEGVLIIIKLRGQQHKASTKNYGLIPESNLQLANQSKYYWKRYLKQWNRGILF